MCGRFAQIHPEKLKALYGAVNAVDYAPNYNVAPGTDIPVIVREKNGEARRLELMRWGLVPFWAKDVKVGYKMINAVAETIESKPAWRKLFTSRRCIVPASGFYEWDQAEKPKQPYYFSPEEGTFSFAGLWDGWKDPDGNWLHSCTIITAAANKTVGKIHNRMPVALPDDESIDLWLSDSKEATALKGLLKPYGDNFMRAWPVSPQMNKPAYKEPGAIAPLENSK